jgi:hypothetical protein
MTRAEGDCIRPLKIKQIRMKTTILSIVFLLIITIGRAADGAGNHTSTRKAATPAVRNILSTQLPARLLTPIKTKYKTYWITDLHKAVSEGKVCYYITLENADQQLKLNTNHSANWQVRSVVTKDIASR